MALRPWLGAVIISFSAVWVRLADVEASRSAMLRGVYALPVLLALVWLRARREQRIPTAESSDANLGGADAFAWPSTRSWLVPLAVGAGLLMGVNLVAWHASIAIIGAGLGTVLPNLQVAFVGIAGVVLFRERPGRGFWFALPILFVGIWLLSAVGRPVVDGGSVVVGVGLGVLAGFAYACWLVIIRIVQARRATPVEVVLLSLTLGSVMVSAPAAAWEGVASPAGWPADGWLVALAIGSQVIGWLLLTSSIHVLPAAATSVALLLQPVLALSWGALLLSEPIGPLQLTGAAIVLAGVAMAHHGARQIRLGTAGARRPG